MTTNADDTPQFNLSDLKLMPEWMKEDASGSNRPARHSERSERPERGERRQGGGGGRQFQRGSDRRRNPRDREKGHYNRDYRDRAPRPAAAPVLPAQVRVEFIPDDKCLTSIARQVRTSHLAYPLFGLARMFLEKPERYRLRISIEANKGENPKADPPQEKHDSAPTELFQADKDGPIAISASALEKVAFEMFKDRFYIEQTVQKDPPKGNFSNVARERLSGVLLGPTNYHAYQSNLHGLYEARFSRRMSFEEFRRNIEVVSDPELVERWKEETRSSTVYKVRDSEPPVVLNDLASAQQHFRQHFFQTLLQKGTSFEIPGFIAQRLPEATLKAAIRKAHDLELKYPATLIHPLRLGLQAASLHIFKHRKRFVYVTVNRPQLFDPGANGAAVSEQVSLLLELVGKQPGITRKELAEKILEKQSEDLEKAKAALAADLRYLVHAGHVIEFPNGTFDLPLPPKSKEKEGEGEGSAKEKETEGEVVSVTPVPPTDPTPEPELAAQPTA